MKDSNKIIIFILAVILAISGIPLVKVISRKKASGPMETMKKIMYQAQDVNSRPDIRLAKPEELNQQTIYDKGKVKDAEKAQDYPVELFGPPSERTIAAAYLPVYPEWVKNKGERLETVLWFHLLPGGAVKDDISVSRSCGYPDMDKIAVDALKEWVFMPSDDGQEQWGQINFRYNP